MFRPLAIVWMATLWCQVICDPELFKCDVESQYDYEQICVHKQPCLNGMDKFICQTDLLAFEKLQQIIQEEPHIFTTPFIRNIFREELCLKDPCDSIAEVTVLFYFPGVASGVWMIKNLSQFHQLTRNNELLETSFTSRFVGKDFCPAFFNPSEECPESIKMISLSHSNHFALMELHSNSSRLTKFSCPHSAGFICSPLYSWFKIIPLD